MEWIGDLEQRVNEDSRKVLILDDDPTGTQTVSNVEVILNPSPDAYKKFFTGTERAAFVLTNTRSMPEREAVKLIRKIKEEASCAAKETGTNIAFILRGDSTLRGHIFPEIDQFSTDTSVCLFVPAFPEGGRKTLNGIHYIDIGMDKLPVAETEFAKDPVFGYKSKTMHEWVAEIGNGRKCITVPLEKLRSNGPSLITEILCNAESGTVIVPDSETYEDIELIVWGLLDAEERGRNVVVRSASTLAAIRAGLHGANVYSVRNEGKVLVICGSHTAASTRQINKLVEHTFQPVIIPSNRAIHENHDSLSTELANEILKSLHLKNFAIISTERERKKEHSDLTDGAKVMKVLTETVKKVKSNFDAIISKGGITSANVATDGLLALHARVRGQLEPGVSLWDLTLENGRTIPYAVVPGNIGHDRTLVEIATKFGVITNLDQTPSSLFSPIEKKDSIVVEITQKLMEYLLSGNIKAGEKLPSERNLSEALGVGRSSLREALKALTLLGLLDVRTGNGTYLKKAESSLLPQIIEWGLLLGEKRTTDLIEARPFIDISIAKLAAQKRSSRDIEELRVIMDQLKFAKDNHNYVEADVSFHMKLAEIARNTVLRDILASIQSLLKTWILTVIESVGSTDFSYEEHYNIFKAVECGDVEGASIAMGKHTESATQRLKSALAGIEEISTR
jgi:DNA-binding FadR family transcriptional regulator/uncharacterized protein YgbK (DUF1537 family)